MKAILILITGLLFSGSALGQSVVFANTISADYRIFTNNGVVSGPMTGTNQWRIGLYVGALGTPENSLVLVGLATNSSIPVVAGYFSGGNPFFLPSPYDEFGITLTFQVRAWAFADGSSYEEAFANGNYLTGKSSLGFVTTGDDVRPPGRLFGTNPGQVSAFTISIPEPSTYALGLLGLALFGLFRRQRR